MCGIFGISLTAATNLGDRTVRHIADDLFTLSESRGKEASGFALCGPDEIRVMKSALPASALIRHREYTDALRDLRAKTYATMIGHARLATDGSAYNEQNNQPVVSDGMVTIHNGIVINNDELWKAHPALTRRLQVDTEIIPALTRSFIASGDSVASATQNTFSLLKGMTSTAVLLRDFNVLVLGTNNGSLYTAYSPEDHLVIFASEELILKKILAKCGASDTIRNRLHIEKVAPNSGRIIELSDVKMHGFKFAGPIPAENQAESPEKRMVELEGIKSDRQKLSKGQLLVGRRSGLDDEAKSIIRQIAEKFPYDTSRADSLRRCTRCILPETMPFISFNDQGVCNYCTRHRPIPYKGKDALLALADRVRRSDGRPDCVVGVSGGRDSLFTLHYVKNVLRLNPVAYTYDWGMVTDLARRNISRFCGKLGIEHILISADIVWKRKNVNRNVSAWLAKPHLGMIPLFLAGDKQYFHYLAKVKKEINVELSIFGENMLERTDFKTGFAGVPPHDDPEHVYTLSMGSKAGLIKFYGGQYLSNPRYINGSILDTLWGAASYYAMERNYINLFGYIPWLEPEVNGTLINDYEFELANDTRSTWRIGDGTAAFYNYIYHTVAGFTENDTFRSNQIREGLITRDEALQKVRIENRPRFETIYWYLNIIEMEMPMEKVIETIRAIPKIQVPKKVLL
jgi:hypothetical protein